MLNSKLISAKPAVGLGHSRPLPRRLRPLLPAAAAAAPKNLNSLPGEGPSGSGSNSGSGAFQIPPPKPADFEMLRAYGYDPVATILNDRGDSGSSADAALSSMEESQTAAPAPLPADELLADLIKAEAGGGDARILDFIHRYNTLAADGLVDPSPTAALPFTPEEILELFPFALDKFQERSFRAVLQGESVVVCAPTGAGKTAIAEACSIAMLATGKRVIYTTPLKALSNQKLYELREKFGSENIGLQTGDVSLNSEALVTVMTTEVLRNILYRAMVEEEEGNQRAAREGEENVTEGSAVTRLSDVGLIVLDEVHYLSDPDRGSVWEEVIIHTPPSTQLLCMSATVANPEDLGGWIRQVHGPCRNVNTAFRPVPLKFWYLHEIHFRTQLMPLLAPGGTTLSKEVEAFRARGDRWRGQSSDRDRGRDDRDYDRPSGGRGRGRSWDDRDFERGGGRGRGRGRESSREEKDGRFGRGRGREREREGGYDRDRDRDERSAPGPPLRMGFPPPLEEAVMALKDRDMLPAIWFIFSRVGCDRAALELHAKRLVLTTPAEQAIIRAEVEKLQAAQPEAVRPALIGPLISGLAAHHAGYLPSWKTLIEKLFQRSLIKIVFATDTLSAGINMPARTTVISQLSRRRGERGTVALTHNELFQMAGRAGRRGFDTEGHCVLVHSGLEGPEDALDVITRGPEALVSQFSTGYGMALSLLASRSLAEARAVVDRSFGAYLGGEGIKDKMEEIQDLEARALQLETEILKRLAKRSPDAPVSLDAFDLPAGESGAFADTADAFDPSGLRAAAAATGRLAQLEEKRALEADVLRQLALQTYDEWLRDSILPLTDALLPSAPPASGLQPMVALLDPTGLGALAAELLQRTTAGEEADADAAPALVPALVLGRVTEGDLASWGLLAVREGDPDRAAALDSWSRAEDWGLAQRGLSQENSADEEDEDEDSGDVDMSPSGPRTEETASPPGPASEAPLDLIRTLRDLGLPPSAVAPGIGFITPFRILCLTSENQLMAVGPEHIAGLRPIAHILQDDGPLPDLPPATAAALTDPAALAGLRAACEGLLMDTADADDPARPATHIEAPFVRPGGAPTAGAALWLSQLIEALDERFSGVDVILPGSADETAAESDESRALWTALGLQAMDPHLLESVLFQWDVLRDTQSKLIEARTGAAKGPKLTKTLERKLSRASKLRRKASRLRRALDAQKEIRWRSFEDVLSVLQEFQAVETGTFRALPLGELARKLRGENELWLAVALMNPATQALPGPALAGTLAALIAHGSIGGRPKVWSKYAPSESVSSCIAALEKDRARLLKLQTARGGSFADKATEGLTVDLRLSGLVEAWAAGASWDQIMSDCNLDDGDVARLLLRTTDMLKQVANLDDAIVWPPLRAAARSALREMTRAPISDLLKSGG